MEDVIMGRPQIYPWNEARVEDFFILPYERSAAVSRVANMNKKFRDGGSERKFKVISYDEINKRSTVKRVR